MKLYVSHSVFSKFYNNSTNLIIVMIKSYLIINRFFGNYVVIKQNGTTQLETYDYDKIDRTAPLNVALKPKIWKDHLRDLDLLCKCWRLVWKLSYVRQCNLVLLTNYRSESHTNLHCYFSLRYYFYTIFVFIAIQ